MRITASKSLLACALAACITMTGCPANETNESEPASLGMTNPRETYEGVRGRITQLPSDGPPPTDLTIHHEHIPTFRGADGEIYVNNAGVEGMAAMVMPFPLLAEGVSLDDLSVGDIVQFDLAVRWDNSTPTYWISELRPLPADTDLDFTNKAPADATEPESEPGAEPESES